MRSIAFVLSPHFQIIDLNAVMAFQLANSLTQVGHYAVSFLSEVGGDVSSTFGIVVNSEPIGTQGHDTLFLIGAPQPLPMSEQLMRLLSTAATSTRRIAAASTAAFQLAEIGLLDGRKATTHWAHVETFKAGYPAVLVEPDRIFVRDGDIWTSAGMSAALDLALALIEDDLGREISCEIAKQLVLYYRRPGAQSQISTLLDLEPQTDRIKRTLIYARRNLQNDLSVEELAEVAHLSPRQFSRLFRSETGQSPAKAVESLRIEAARIMLQEGRLPLETVARHVGFTDRDRMCRAFVRATGQTPSHLKDTGLHPRPSVSLPEGLPSPFPAVPANACYATA
ncbi:transcriptional regulator [Azorhizobium oxalatiphilum]|uniref:Transcriptional regulator n=1 Tax=Azorhizobium oxalatiphilum TaxID=980631 RepID=A0A917CE56_9HYPH|nr:transcriptional regulator [Azorhizobium oxalatiphilum]